MAKTPFKTKDEIEGACAYLFHNMPQRIPEQRIVGAVHGLYQASGLSREQFTDALATWIALTHGAEGLRLEFLPTAPDPGETRH